MATKMVFDDWDYSLTSINKSAVAIEKLMFTETTAGYFDGKNLSKSINQTYDATARNELKKVTRELLENFHTFYFPEDLI